MTDIAPVLRRGRSEDASAVAEIWSPGWRDAHLGNVPDTLVAVHSRPSPPARRAFGRPRRNPAAVWRIS
ncbi:MULTISPECIES: hypothetical protein [Nocardia]|uniref:hypothetical protein n=1 Tax=Nocardia abscessus TaxID=120957 RepID=UPI001E5B1CBF|nr:hypothetical protein [Nocardia abscessus]